MTHYGIETTLAAVLEAVADRVVSQAGFSADRVFDTLASDEDHCRFPPADEFVTVTPQRFPADQPTFAGGGRALFGVNGVLRVALLARFASDQELRDSRLLRDRTRAIALRFLDVLGALQGYNPPETPQDATRCILREPMRSDQFELLPRRVKDGPWAVLASTWQVKFSIALPGGHAPAGT